MENAEDMESFLLFLARNFHIFRMVFIIIPTCKEWGSRGRRFDSCHSDHIKTTQSFGWVVFILSVEIGRASCREGV